MEQAFYFGTVVSKRVFLNRKAELERLQSNIRNGLNTILISPGRWGKSSLVLKATELLKDDKIRFVHMDLFRVSTKRQFLEHFSTQILKATQSKPDELPGSIGKSFSGLVADLNEDPGAETGFNLRWKDDDLPEEEILDLPQLIARHQGIKLVICMYEFQNLTGFDKDHSFQKTLRSYWQHQSEVSFILCGSKRSLMYEFFAKQTMPFYSFGDILLMEKITTAHWVEYIQWRYGLFGKLISPAIAARIARLMDDHSYYVQQLAYVTFQNTEKETTEETLKFSLDMMLQQNQILYRKMINDLSANQIEFLRAMSDGVTQFYKKKYMREYDLGSVGNIKRIKEALESKEVVDFFEPKAQFLDPAFALWFRKYYLQRSID